MIQPSRYYASNNRSVAVQLAEALASKETLMATVGGLILDYHSSLPIQTQYWLALLSCIIAFSAEARERLSSSSHPWGTGAR